MAINGNWPENTNLDNLIPYTHLSAAWSDRHSNMAITWERPHEVGLGRLQALWGWSGTPLTLRLLNWMIEENGTTYPLRVQSRNFRPDKVIECDAGPGLVVTTTAAWPERNVIAVAFEIENQTSNRRTLQVRFNYPSKGNSPTWNGPYPLGFFESARINSPGFCVNLDDEPEGSWSTLFYVLELGRDNEWLRAYATGLTNGTTLEMVCLADLSPRSVILDPRGKASFTIFMALGKNRGQARVAHHAAQQKLDAGWTPEEETRRLHKLLASAPVLPPRYRGQAPYERSYAHAIAGLDSLFIQGEGGYIGTRRLPFTTKEHLALPFFWDSCWSALGAREFNTAMSQEPIECFTENVNPRGAMPGVLCDTAHAGEGQAPIMAWTAWQVYQRSLDKAFLAHVYPGLVSHHNFWFRYHVSPRGLAQWFRPDSYDDDARWDPIYGGDPHGRPIFGLDSPDINAFLVVWKRSLAKIARELGRPDEANRWDESADQLAQLIVDTMYFPDQALFLDVKVGTREPFTGVKTPSLFLPLWASVPLPEKEVRRVIEEHMLNPAEFFRELPYPSLSFDNPKYDPGGYWRGRIWPHFSFWMMQILWQWGYRKEAELTADRVLKMYQKTPWHHENYNSATGEGWDGVKYRGFPEYNWAHATVIMLLLERYKEPVL